MLVGVFSGIFKARMLKLGIYMDNEFLYCGIKNWTTCSYSFLRLSIFLSFTAKFLSQYSSELCKLESSNMVYIHVSRMSDYIVGLRLTVMALIFLFLSVFLSFPILHVHIKNLFSQEFLKLECWNLLYTWTISCCIVGLRRSNSLLLFFPLFVHFYLVFFVSVLRLLRVSVTVFFATYLFFLIYSSALLKQCSGAIARFSDSSSLRLNLCHTPELCKLESSNVVYICRMSDCIVWLRVRVMALIFLIFIHFSFFPQLRVNIKNSCRSFLRNF